MYRAVLLALILPAIALADDPKPPKLEIDGQKLSVWIDGLRSNDAARSRSSDEGNSCTHDAIPGRDRFSRGRSR